MVQRRTKSDGLELFEMKTARRSAPCSSAFDKPLARKPAYADRVTPIEQNYEDWTA